MGVQYEKSSISEGCRSVTNEEIDPSERMQVAEALGPTFCASLGHAFCPSYCC